MQERWFWKHVSVYVLLYWRDRKMSMVPYHSTVRNRLSGFPYCCIFEVISRSTAVLVPLSVLKAFCFFAKSSISFSSNGVMLTETFIQTLAVVVALAWCCLKLIRTLAWRYYFPKSSFFKIFFTTLQPFESVVKDLQGKKYSMRVVVVHLDANPL